MKKENCALKLVDEIILGMNNLLNKNTNSVCGNTLEDVSVGRQPTQARSTRSSRATCYPRHSVRLPAETCAMRKHILSFSLINPRQNAEAILKTSGLFIYGDTHHIFNSLFK